MDADLKVPLSLRFRPRTLGRHGGSVTTPVRNARPLFLPSRGYMVHRVRRAVLIVWAAGFVTLPGLQDLARALRGQPHGDQLSVVALGINPALSAFFREHGLFTFVRWHSFFTNPPLTISEEELREGFAIVDRALDLTDGAMVG